MTSEVAPASSESRKPLRILCLDGGGIKGYSSLLILKRLFREIKHQNGGVEQLPCEVFDLIVGTSTGGLIATMLGRVRLSIDDCLTQYRKVGNKVFGRKPIGGKAGRILRGLVNSPFYDIEKLQSGVRELVGLQTGPQGTPFDPKFCPVEQAYARGKVMLCVTRSEAQQPEVLRSYPTWATSEENYDCDIWEAASATAAAPIYFKPVPFARTGEKWCDGGLKRNNPINEALNEVVRHEEFRTREIGCVVSIGTGITSTTGISSNLLVFLEQAVKMMTWSEEIADTFEASELGTQLSMSKRYYRFNVQQGLQDFEMDELDRLEEMDALTKAYLRKKECAKAIADCAESLLNPEGRLQSAVAKPLNLLKSKTCNHHLSRQEHLLSLESFFNGQATVKRFVLWGTGGMGKTQIALEYAQNRSRNGHVFWVRCEQYASFGQDFGRIFATLKESTQSISEQSNDDMILKRSRLVLDELDNFLLVLDNADDLDQFLGRAPGTTNLSSYLPSKGDILITTRDPRFLGGFVPAGQGKRVRELERCDALSLLLKSIPGHLAGTARQEETEKLLDQLGDLPLAIAQAAANVTELQIDLSTYISFYQNRTERTIVMQEPFFDSEANDERNKLQSVYVTWEISFDFLEAKHKLSATCLQVMALLHWTAIPLDLLVSLPFFGGLTPLEFHAAIKKLLHLSLIEESAGDGFVEYSLHRMVHEVILDRLKRRSYSILIGLLETTAGHVTDLFPFVGVEKKENEFELARYLLPHALRQLQLLEDLQIVSHMRAGLLQRASNYLTESGQSQAATHLSTQALDVALQVWLPDDIYILCIRKTVAACLLRDAKYGEAETVALQCREMLDYRNILEKLDDHDRLLKMVDISNLYDQSLYGQHKYDQFNISLRKTIDVAMKAGFSRRDMRPLFNDLANNFTNIGKLDEARQLNDNLIEEVSADLEYLRTNRAFFGAILTAQIRILEKLNQGKDLVEKEQLRTQILRLREEILDHCLADGGMESVNSWKASNSLLWEYMKPTNCNWKGALALAIDVLKLALDSNVVIQGQFLTLFSIFASYVSTILAAAGTTPSAKVELLRHLLDNFMSEQDLTINDLERSSVFLNSVAVHLQEAGQFEAAETRLRCALKAPDLSTAGLKGRPHYNLMLAIAQQPGRLSEAFQYRKDHQSLIMEVESISGSLEQRIETWDTEHGLYAEAKERISSGDLDWHSDWCQAHKQELYIAQMRWGWLYEEANPWLEHDSECNEQVESI